MKKITTIIIALLPFIFVSACGSTAVQNTTDNNQQASNVIEASKAPEPTASESAQTVMSNSNAVSASKSSISSEKVEFIKDYSVKQYDSSKFTYHIIVIKNNNDVPVDIKSNTNAFDINENLIGAKSSSLAVLGSGETSVIVEMFEDIDNVDHYDTTFSVAEPLYNEIDSIIEMNLNSSTNKVFVTLNNIGENPAMFMRAHVIFLDAGGNAIYYDSKYINGSDNEIKPGESITEEIKCSSDFSSAEVYFEGRRKKWVKKRL